MRLMRRRFLDALGDRLSLQVGAIANFAYHVDRKSRVQWSFFDTYARALARQSIA